MFKRELGKLDGLVRARKAKKQGRYAQEAVQKRLGLASKRMVWMYRNILDDGPDLA